MEPKLERVQFQTHARCNGHCTYCPQPIERANGRYRRGDVDQKLFERVVLELDEMRTEWFIPYLQNEPLLDKEIHNRIAFVKENTNMKVELSSNGAALTAKIRAALVKLHIDEIRFSVPTIDATEYKRIMGFEFEDVLNNIIEYKKALDVLENPTTVKIYAVDQRFKLKEWRFWKSYGIQYEEVFLSTRAGLINNPKVSTEFHKGTFCFNEYRDLRWMHILYTGRVILCCNDYQYKTDLGSLTESSVAEIWAGEKYEQVRGWIRGENTPSDFLCRRCEYYR